MKQRILKSLRQFILLAIIGFFSLINPTATATSSPVNVWEVVRSQLRLDHELNQPDVQAQIRWLVSHPNYLEELSKSERYIYHIITEIQRRHLPGELALLPMIESTYDPFAYSGAGAAGLWQIMPGTGTELGLKQDWWYDGRRSIGASTNAALNYLDYLRNQFTGNWILAIASYDAGEGTISKALKNANQTPRSVNFWHLNIPHETRVYVPRLLALAEIIKYPERYHVVLPDIPHEPYFKEVTIDSQIDLNKAAKLAGISYRELLKLNPGFNRWATAPNQPFKLLIPTEKVNAFYEQLAITPKNKRVSWARYEVRSGDNLPNIAHRYFTTVKLLRELNQLHSDKLKQGQKLLLPSSKTISNNTQPTPSATQHAAPPRRAIKQITLGNYKVIHIVQSRDTFNSIAQKYQTSANAIKQWNHITANSPLQKNQQLIIWKTRRA